MLCEYSIILTIHNKDFLVKSVLESILKHTTGRYELIIVLDGCNDLSEKIVLEYLKYSGMNFKILYANNVFETKANNLGLKFSNGKYCIIMQDDMVINETSWNERLSYPLKKFSDVFAVTAQTAHNWSFNKNSIHINLKNDLDDCWCDILIHTEHANKSNLSRQEFGIRECVNRGPLLLDFNIIQQVDFFDETFSPQDMDDHDLCYRVYKKFEKVVGCFWIDYISRNEWGGTRVNGQTQPWLFKANHKNVKIVWNRHQDLILSTKNNKNRICL